MCTVPLGCDRGIQRHEQIQLFPTYGRYRPDSGDWECDISGWIYEVGGRARTAGLVTRDLLLEDESRDERELGSARVQRFFVDNETNEAIPVLVADTLYTPPRSDGSGFFRGRMTLSGAAVLAAAREPQPASRLRELTCKAVLPAGDTREFTGTIQLIPSEGLSVISDIDDTLRVARGDGKVERTEDALRYEYTPVAGMAELYQRWRTQRAAAFHYVSNNAWQLSPWMLEFFERCGFPSGSLHLRRYHVRLFGGIRGEGPAKREAIVAILKDFPRRRFLLIGDSVEQDPEVYGEIARQFPQQVECIYIRLARKHEDDPPSERRSARMQAAFRDVPGNHWRLFTDPSEVQ